MRIEWISADDLVAIAPIWRALCEATRPSYFQSWSWVENWLRTIPSRRALKLGVISEGGAPVAAFFMGSALRRRHGFVLSLAKYLNETGDPVVDDLCIEFNSVLWAASAKPELRAVLDQIPGIWDELYLAGLDAARFPGDALTCPSSRYKVEELKRVPSYFVDLDAVRKRGEYVPLLSSNTRAQVRRTYRLYEADGPITLEAPTGLNESRAIFRELVDLHQSHWTAAGEPGAFASEFSRQFHLRLMAERQGTGEVQLLRVCVAGRTVGCLYGFAYEGTLHQYQAGLVYGDANRDRRPGYLCNTEAIKHNAELGLARYDFLGGRQSYKERLSTGKRSLVWARVQKPRFRFWLEQRAKVLRDTWREYRSPETTEVPRRAGGAETPSDPP